MDDPASSSVGAHSGRVVVPCDLAGEHYFLAPVEDLDYQCCSASMAHDRSSSEGVTYHMANATKSCAHLSVIFSSYSRAVVVEMHAYSKGRYCLHYLDACAHQSLDRCCLSCWETCFHSLL